MPRLMVDRFVRECLDNGRWVRALVALQALHHRDDSRLCATKFCCAEAVLRHSWVSALRVALHGFQHHSSVVLPASSVIRFAQRLTVSSVPEEQQLQYLSQCFNATTGPVIAGLLASAKSNSFACKFVQLLRPRYQPVVLHEVLSLRPTALAAFERANVVSSDTLQSLRVWHVQDWAAAIALCTPRSSASSIMVAVSLARLAECRWERAFILCGDDYVKLRFVVSWLVRCNRLPPPCTPSALRSLLADGPSSHHDRISSAVITWSLSDPLPNISTAAEAAFRGGHQVREWFFRAASWSAALQLAAALEQSWGLCVPMSALVRLLYRSQCREVMCAVAERLQRLRLFGDNDWLCVLRFVAQHSAQSMWRLALRSVLTTWEGQCCSPAVATAVFAVVGHQCPSQWHLALQRFANVASLEDISWLASRYSGGPVVVNAALTTPPRASEGVLRGAALWAAAQASSATRSGH